MTRAQTSTLPASKSAITVEVCDHQDNDCDGRVDEGVTITCYVDEDGDGYSPGGPGTEHCGSCPAKTTPRAPTSGQVDCDDNDPDANPGNAEAVFPCDGIDNDCDGRVDEDGTTLVDCYRDQDGDGYGAGAMMRVACACPAGWVTQDGDCVDVGDRAHLIHPGADFQTEPHCDGGSACVNLITGAFGCYPTCAPGQLCVCSEKPSWDYNCDSVVETVAQASCTRDSSTTPPLCFGPSGPLNVPTSADCGTEVTRGGLPKFRICV